jgi:outer membrane protein OmpA-like peptidoglycan-associated protein
MKNTYLVAAAVSLVLAACASMPKAPEGSVELRNRLTTLESNAALVKQVPVAIQDAEAAVKLAETPQGDREVAAHRVYMADHKIEMARALGEAQMAEAQRAALKEQNDSNRLQARTHEADAATASANSARDEAGAAAALSREKVAEMQRQIEILQARATDRGIVLTLGDVLFATGKSELQSGATGNLDRLVTFLGKYSDRTVMIEGYTDSVGDEGYNQNLSLRRADAVRSYLTSHGVALQRLTTEGKGESSPVAGNDSAAGRQQNRRVEVIIANGPQPTAAVLR